MSEFESREYATLVSCTDKLETALTDDRGILHFLENERCLPNNVDNPNASPLDKAVLVVKSIKRKSKIDPQNYNKLTDYFHTNERKYREIITTLDQAYHKIGLSQNDQLSPRVDTSITVADIMEGNIRDSFTDLVEKVVGKLKTENINVNDFRLYLITRFACGNFISNISSVPEMIEAVARKPLWNHINYIALEGIIKRFARDDSELIGRMDEYKTKLTAFKATTKIADYIEDCTEDELMADTDEDCKMQYDKRFYRRLAFKLKENKNSILRVNEICLSYIENLWKSISLQFFLPSLPILLGKICNGCIEVTWIVPITIALTIDLMVASQTSIEFYQQKNIVRVTMDDRVIYDEVDEVIPIVTEDLATGIIETHDTDDMTVNSDLISELLTQLKEIEKECSLEKEKNLELNEKLLEGQSEIERLRQTGTDQKYRSRSGSLERGIGNIRIERSELIDAREISELSTQLKKIRRECSSEREKNLKLNDKLQAQKNTIQRQEKILQQVNKDPKDRRDSHDFQDMPALHRYHSMDSSMVERYTRLRGSMAMKSRCKDSVEKRSSSFSSHTRLLAEQEEFRCHAVKKISQEYTRPKNKDAHQT